MYGNIGNIINLLFFISISTTKYLKGHIEIISKNIDILCSLYKIFFINNNISLKL